jgi:hypothetical protein
VTAVLAKTAALFTPYQLERLRSADRSPILRLLEDPLTPVFKTLDTRDRKSHG